MSPVLSSFFGFGVGIGFVGSRESRGNFANKFGGRQSHCGVCQDVGAIAIQVRRTHQMFAAMKHGTVIAIPSGSHPLQSKILYCIPHSIPTCDILLVALVPWPHQCPPSDGYFLCWACAIALNGFCNRLARAPPITLLCNSNHCWQPEQSLLYGSGYNLAPQWRFPSHRDLAEKQRRDPGNGTSTLMGGCTPAACAAWNILLLLLARTSTLEGKDPYPLADKSYSWAWDSWIGVSLTQLKE